jgi:hypothetical protein
MKKTLLPFAAALLLASCTQPSVDGGSAASSSSSATSSVSSVPAGWLTYDNAEYGMSFRYPAHFGELHAGAEAYGKNYGLRIEDNSWVYEGQMMPLLSLQGENIDPTFSHSLHVESFPLQGYSRVMMYDDEYNYDAATKTWTTSLGGETKTPETVMMGGRTAYLFPFGDAGSAAMTYAIPLEEKGVVIELTYSSCVACLVGGSDMTEDQALIDENAMHAAVEQQQIVDSVEFL